MYQGSIQFAAFYKYYGKHVKRWRGFQLQAVDGTSVYLLNKQEIVNHFGTHNNQHVAVPMARVMQVYDILNDITVWGYLSYQRV